jgi:hypothetical protein
VALERVGVLGAARLDVAREHVEHLVHGADIDEVGLQVLGADVLDCEREAARAHKPLEAARPVLVDAEDGVGDLHERVDGRVVVDLRHQLARRRPVDRLVRLAVELGTERRDERVGLGGRVGEALSVEVAHRQVDHPASERERGRAYERARGCEGRVGAWGEEQEARRERMARGRGRGDVCARFALGTHRQWHQRRPGWKGSQSGRSQSSGGMGWCPSQSITPSRHM